MKITPKNVVTMTLTGHCETGARTRVQARKHSIVIDEPSERGGDDLGPSPTETLLAALVGCTNRITHTVAERNGVEIGKLAVKVEAKFDRRCLSEEMDVPFPEIRNFIEITTNASAPELEKVKADLVKYCPVSKVIRQSGTKVTDIWTVIRPKQR